MTHGSLLAFVSSGEDFIGHQKRRMRAGVIHRPGQLSPTPPPLPGRAPPPPPPYHYSDVTPGTVTAAPGPATWGGRGASGPWLRIEDSFLMLYKVKTVSSVGLD